MDGLTSIERFAIRAGRWINETSTGKRAQELYLRGISYSWVHALIAPRLLVQGLPELIAQRPTTGVMFVSNHRSFFDQYAMLVSVYRARAPWAKRLFFPVRANFFYERPAGLLVNYAVAAGSMYPPVFRQAERGALNEDAVDRAVRFLREPGTVVGLHPEGTRGKGPDPYTFLPAQPGAGKMALLSGCMVIPWYIGGLGNDVAKDAVTSFTPGSRRTAPIIAVAGAPIDLSDLAKGPLRPTLYKRAADRMMTEVGNLGAQEKQLRADCAAGLVGDDDPRWLANLPGRAYFPPRGD